jgi:hypothetical protein
VAFPNTPIIEYFPGANIADLGPAWSTNIYNQGFPSFARTNHNAVSGAGSAGNYWNSGTFQSDSECYGQLGSTLTAGGRGPSVHIRLQNPISGNAYAVKYDTSATPAVILYRNDAATVNVLATKVQTLSPGDWIGVQCIGSTISSYYKIGAGAWTLANQVTDATYSGPGWLGILHLDAFSDSFAQVGGGSIGQNVLTINSPTMLVKR